ncbi:MAG TPA: hypothetical protein VGH33_19995 [Isosphaeraceae bacterium]
MPLFHVKTREKYVHVSRYDVHAPTAAAAVQMVRNQQVSDYDATEIDGYAPDDEFLGVIEVTDERGQKILFNGDADGPDSVS